MKKLFAVLLCMIMLVTYLAFPSVAIENLETEWDDSIFEIWDVIGAKEFQTIEIAGQQVNYVKIAEAVEDKQVYKVTLRYKASVATPLSFMTADNEYITVNPGFVEAENYTVCTAAVCQNNSNMTTYVCIDMEGGENGEGNALYLYWPADCDFSVYNAELEKLGTVVGNGGVSMIKTNDASMEQALRYYFNYDTNTGKELVFNGETFKIVSRGFLMANGGNGGLSEAAVTRETAKSNNKIKDLNITELTKCWTVKENENGTNNITFSTYVTKFAAEGGTYNLSKKLYVKAYIEVLVGTQNYTFYSSESCYTVKDVADKSWYHNEGAFVNGNEVPDDKKEITLNNVTRELVWNQEFNLNGIMEGVTTNVDTMSPDSVVKTSTSEDNIFVNGGSLVLRMKDNGDNTFTTAKSLTTSGVMSFKYGYVEMRAKLPYQYGMWSSFWMQPDKNLVPENFKYYGEVDIVETWWTNKMTEFTLHKWLKDYSVSKSQVKVNGNNEVDVSNHGGNREYIFDDYTNLKNEYHIYGFEWTPEYMKAYIDGECYYTIYIDEDSDFSEEYSGMECFHDYYYLCWNNWMQPTYAEQLELENGYADYAIDYVRVYQNTESEFIKKY